MEDNALEEAKRKDKYRRKLLKILEKKRAEAMESGDQSSQIECEDAISVVEATEDVTHLMHKHISEHESKPTRKPARNADFVVEGKFTTMFV